MKRLELNMINRIMIDNFWIDYEYLKMFGIDKKEIPGIKLQEMIVYCNRHNKTMLKGIKDYQFYSQLKKMYKRHNTYGYMPYKYSLPENQEYFPVDLRERRKIWYGAETKILNNGPKMTFDQSFKVNEVIIKKKEKKTLWQKLKQNLLLMFRNMTTRLIKR